MLDKPASKSPILAGNSSASNTTSTPTDRRSAKTHSPPTHYSLKKIPPSTLPEHCSLTQNLQFWMKWRRENTARKRQILRKTRTNSKGVDDSDPCCATRTRLSRKSKSWAYNEPSDVSKLRAWGWKLCNDKARALLMSSFLQIHDCVHTYMFWNTWLCTYLHVLDTLKT